MSMFNRRDFLKSGTLAAPLLLSGAESLAEKSKNIGLINSDSPVLFFGDGKFLNPTEYIGELQKINEVDSIKADSYGKGGVVEELEQKFCEITGKERAIYLPSGTMANQLAINSLSGENTKVIVQEVSHVYRDEADAAQSVFNKRLIPLAKDEAYFTAEQLEEGISNINNREVFRSGIGVVSIENSVRRANERSVPLDEIVKIRKFCNQQGMRMHLDGARIYMASVWNNIAVREYSKYFDTVYVSLYKYLGAGGGAILCGDKSLIDGIGHQIKVHGGNMFTNWSNAAMALYNLKDIDEKLRKVVKKGEELRTALNKIDGLSITTLKGGTNTLSLTAKGINSNEMRTKLRDNYNMYLRPANNEGVIFLTLNETLLNQSVDEIVKGFRASVG